MHVWNTSELLRQRADQPSFHIASERHLRVEFRRFAAGEQIAPVRITGDVLLSVIEGEFRATGGATVARGEQLLFPEGEHVAVECDSPSGVLQLIWAPASAARATPTH